MWEFLHRNLGTGSIHVAAEEASVPAESSYSSKFHIIAVLSAVVQCLSALKVSVRIPAGFRIVRTAVRAREDWCCHGGWC